MRDIAYVGGLTLGSVVLTSIIIAERLTYVKQSIKATQIVTVSLSVGVLLVL